MASSAASGSRASIQPLSSEQQEAVIKSRMQVDERTLRRVVKKLTLLLSSTDAEVVAASRLSFQSELEAFRLQLARLSSIARNTSEVEISSYTHELSEIESEQEATQARIHALKRRLDEVRRERKNKLEYDVVAGEIVKLPTRAELDESLARLREQLDQVRAEREKYTHMSHDAAQRMRGVIDVSRRCATTLATRWASASVVKWSVPMAMPTAKLAMRRSGRRWIRIGTRQACRQGQRRAGGGRGRRAGRGRAERRRQPERVVDATQNAWRRRGAASSW